MKKGFTTIASVAAAALLLTACGGGSDAPTDATTDGATGAATDTATGDSYSVGILQLVDHASLDQANQGFVQAFEDAGIDVSFDQKNANGDQTVASTIAGTFAAQDLDLVLAIATPAAQAAAQAITNVPVLITAVTDPVDAALVDSLDAPGGNVTGTTDANPVEEQLQLIKDI
ncbi:MAG: sugar ABC transporter substrate-binding protein, partial [Ruaniaceae bacterium]|nr:sugar ABC transporter substrate-binding protein [Ruaniaceae bacterium]